MHFKLLMQFVKYNPENLSIFIFKKKCLDFNKNSADSVIKISRAMISLPSAQQPSIDSITAMRRKTRAIFQNYD